MHSIKGSKGKQAKAGMFTFFVLYALLFSSENDCGEQYIVTIVSNFWH